MILWQKKYNIGLKISRYCLKNDFFDREIISAIILRDLLTSFSFCVFEYYMNTFFILYCIWLGVSHNKLGSFTYLTR